ncbi:FAD-dependent oxidoreductase [Streptacidiphilus sp. EB129]|uniref:FAD-dependent oxidoreductase n=1 Tax=Streptacidiphilus sp. EB129 TaxID=3156262 RepID=UPI00351699C8
MTRSDDHPAPEPARLAERAGLADPVDPGGRADLAVVGAGPAGLAAAVTAADLGLRTVLLDAAPRPGGQFYRRPAPGLGARRPEALHHGWSAFANLALRLGRHTASGSVEHLAEHHVWSVRAVDGGWLLHALVGPEGGAAATVHAAAVLFATGAHERQLPFPGWTLPGVVGAGGAQAMLKAGLVLPGRRVVVAGSGPLLLAVAASLAEAGARVPLVAEAAGYGAYARGARTLAANPAKLAEGAGYGARLLRHRVPVRSRSAVVAAHGRERVEAVTVARLDRDWRPLPGSERRIACDAVATGYGLLPQLELPAELGCRTRTLPDGSPALEVDAEQRTSVAGVWAAGETTGVGGAALALAEGELAARSVAARLRGAHEAPSTQAALSASAALSVQAGPPAQAAPPAPAGPSVQAGPSLQAGLADAGHAADRVMVRRVRRLRAFADLMAAVHRPAVGWTGWLTDDTEICRCEEVTAAQVAEAVTELGAGDARTVKLLTRAGMGWCQGRMCGPAVARLAGADADPVGNRPLSCPVPLGLLARDGQ